MHRRSDTRTWSTGRDPKSHQNKEISTATNLNIDIGMHGPPKDPLIQNDILNLKYRIDQMSWYFEQSSIKGFNITYKHRYTGKSKAGIVHGITSNYYISMTLNDDKLQTIYYYASSQEIVSIRFVTIKHQILQIGVPLESVDDFNNIHAIEISKKMNLEQISSYFDSESQKLVMFHMRYC